MRVVWLALRIVAFPLRLIVGPLFRELEVRAALGDQAAFERQIRLDASVLFERRGAEVVKNEGILFPPLFDGAFVTLRSDGMKIRFEKGRGDFNVLIAAIDDSDWTDLEALLGAIQSPYDIRRIRILDIADAGRELDSHWHQLRRSLESETVKDLIHAFYEREKRSMRAMDKALNRRLYGG